MKPVFPVYFPILFKPTNSIVYMPKINYFYWIQPNCSWAYEMANGPIGVCLSWKEMRRMTAHLLRDLKTNKPNAKWNRAHEEELDNLMD